MQLTRFTDYGLRTLMYLTRHDRNLPITIQEIATQFAVPHNHLIKVCNRLTKLGWVISVRGRNGGLHLAVAPADLRLGRVLRELEGHEDLINCNEPLCVLSGNCMLKGALNAGLTAFYAKMDEYTLADVSGRQTGEKIIQMHQQFLAGILPGDSHDLTR